MLLAVCAFPGRAMAQDDDRVVVDARLEGLTAEGSSAIVNVTEPIKDRSALYWFLFIAMGLLALGAMFKDSRRTHLD